MSKTGRTKLLIPEFNGRKMMTERTGRNISKWSLLGLSLTGILFSLFLVYSPPVGAFGGADAKCKDGSTVSCSGYRCSATDNVGCTCYDSAGKVEDKKPCPKGGEGEGGFVMLEESDY